MTESTMQYLVSLSDSTMEKIIDLQDKWGWSRDRTIEQAINFLSNANVRPMEERRKTKDDNDKENEYR